MSIMAITITLCLAVEFLITLQVMLRFTLDGDNPYEFASRASQFAESLEEILSEVYEFDDVNAVILGVGKSSCGVT